MGDERETADARARAPHHGGARPDVRDVARPDFENALQRLGAGGNDDRLPLRLAFDVLRRCHPWLRAERIHLVALAAGFGALAVLLVPPVALMFDVIWTRILGGAALTPIEATVLRVDPAVAVDVATLAPAMRRLLAERIVVASALGAIVAVPAVLALVYYQIWILQRINQRLRERLFDRLQSLSLRTHAGIRVGDAIYRLHQDSAMVTQLIDVLLLTPLFSLTRFGFGLAVVFSFDPWLALALLSLWPPLLMLGGWVSPRLRVHFRAAREAQSALVARIQETLAGVRVLKAHGAELRAQQRFEIDSREAFSRAFAARSLLALFGVAVFGVIGCVVLATSATTALATRVADPIFAGRLFGLAGFSAWNLGLWNFFKQRFGDGAGSMRVLFGTWARIQDIVIGLDRTFELLDLAPEVQDAPDAIDLPPLRRAVTFRDVSFSYAAGRKTLANVSFEARAGSITAIVGPTGSGKSTLMSLLVRLFDPDEGTIEIDGLDLRRVRLDSLRAGVSIALQENLLFGATIRENIRYAVPQASDDAVRAAARIACADEFIERLPAGYDTMLGERGTKLSSGQRQRLSIARAILKNAPILILDEPTASLDAATELRVLQNLAAWGRDRAIFLVTHRLSTIRRAHRIICIAEGCVVEQGTHSELVAREGGAYRCLVDHEQAGLASLATEPMS